MSSCDRGVIDGPLCLWTKKITFIWGVELRHGCPVAVPWTTVHVLMSTRGRRINSLVKVDSAVVT